MSALKTFKIVWPKSKPQRGLAFSLSHPVVKMIFVSPVFQPCLLKAYFCELIRETQCQSLQAAK